MVVDTSVMDLFSVGNGLHPASQLLHWSDLMVMIWGGNVKSENEESSGLQFL